MTPKQFADAGVLLHGKKWLKAFADDFDLKKRVVRKYASGQTNIPAKVENRLKHLLDKKVVALNMFLDGIKD
jgi:hypothetical protein